MYFIFPRYLRPCYLHMIITAIILLPTLMLSQESSISDSLIVQYLNHYKNPRISAAVHTPKSHFFVGEKLWFTVFLYDHASGKLSEDISNLYASLFDKDLQEVRSEILLVENGTAKGYFEIDSLASGSYILKVSNPYLSRVNPYAPAEKLVRINSMADLPAVSEEKIHVYPEGGLTSVITGVPVNFGVHIPHYRLDTHGPPRLFLRERSGRILLDDIPINDLGYAKFSFIPEKDTSYQLGFELNGRELQYTSIPPAHPNGVAISLNNLAANDVYMELKASQNEYEAQWENNVYMAIHQLDSIKMMSVNPDQNSNKISVKRDQLFDGINVISVFNKDHDLLARRLFHNRRSLKPNPGAKVQSVKRISGDSLLVEFSIDTPSTVTYSTALSMVPEQLKNISQPDLAYSMKLLPYLKLPPGSYEAILNNDRKSVYDLDLILLTHPMHAELWPEMDASHDPELPFEDYLTVQGRVTNAGISGYSITFFQPGNTTINALPINANKEFKEDGVVLFKELPTVLTLNSPAGIGDKPNLEVTLASSFNMPKPRFVPVQPEITDTSAPALPLLSSGFSIPKDAIALEEIVLTSKRVKEVLGSEYNLITNNYTAIPITEREDQIYHKLSRILQRLGFAVDSKSMWSTISIRSRLPQTRPPVIFIDGQRIRGDIQNFNLSNIEAIFYEKEGMNGSNGGSLYFITRDRPAPWINTGENVEHKIFDFGYQAPMPYTHPDYNYQSEAFEQFGVVYYEPLKEMTGNTTYTIKIADTHQTTLAFNLCGIGSDGSMLQEELLIEIPE